MYGLDQIKRLKSQIALSFSSFVTSNFSISVKSNTKLGLSEKIYKISKASDFSHSKVSIWWGSFKSHQENDDQMSLVRFF